MAYELAFLKVPMKWKSLVRKNRFSCGGSATLRTFEEMEKVNMHLKYDINTAFRVILQEHLAQFGISGNMSGMGIVELDRKLSQEQYRRLEDDLKKYGIEIIDNSKSALVQQIKDAIMEYVCYHEKKPGEKLSSWITWKLNLSYSYISRIFSEETLTSIENYMIMQRIERVKHLIACDRMTFTEIAWKMNYSSVAHLSNQFKKVTGITPTRFQKMITKRNRPYLSKNRKSHVKVG
jgi:AraC-like DNA-binding protein